MNLLEVPEALQQKVHATRHSLLFWRLMKKIGAGISETPILRSSNTKRQQLKEPVSFVVKKTCGLLFSLFSYSYI